MALKQSTQRVPLSVTTLACDTFRELEARHTSGREQWRQFVQKNAQNLQQMPIDATRMERQETARLEALLREMAEHRRTCRICSLEDAAPVKRASAQAQKLLEASDLIYGEDPADLRFLHVVLAQCGLPYREVRTRDYIKTNGRASLILTAGYLQNRGTHRPELQGIPYGAKPRLLMIHLCTAAKRQKSPEVEIGTSMSAFMRDLGLGVTGGKKGSIGRFKEQLNRLAATHMQLLFEDEEKTSMMNPSPAISRYDVWFPKDPEQRMLWPTTVTLGTEFFQSLMSENAMPLDARAIRALQHSAMALDIYTWLAHRLRRIPAQKPANISWAALRDQFGPQYQVERRFRQEFGRAMRQVLQVYSAARVEMSTDNLTLRQSPAPIASRTLTQG